MWKMVKEYLMKLGNKVKMTAKLAVTSKWDSKIKKLGKQVARLSVEEKLQLQDYLSCNSDVRLHLVTIIE